MSLILDALNRADRERSEQQQVPSVHAAPLPTSSSSRPILRWLVEGLLATTLIAVVVHLFFFQQPDGPKALTLEKTPVSTSALQIPDSAQMQKTLTTPHSNQSQNISLPEPSPPPSATPSVGTAIATALKTTEAPSTNTAIAQLYRQNMQVSAAVKTNPAVPTVQSSTQLAAQPPPRNEQAKSSAQDILQQIPLLTSLSSRFQQSIPNIDYSAHLYNDQDSSGVVKLNGALRKIGSEPAPGLRVIAILPDSVVLSYNGIQFRLLALNSWINYH